MTAACDDCLGRAWLLEALSGHLDRARGRVEELLELDDAELLAAAGGGHAARLERERSEFDPKAAREVAAAAGLELVCRCDPAYPARLRGLPSAPAVLHVSGGMDRLLAGARTEAVAIVGSRAATPYGIGIARSLGRGLAACGLSVVSGMALGVDAAAHRGALSAGPSALAVLPGGPDRPYPKSHRALYRDLIRCGAVVSELPPGTRVRRWMFPARNRIIAALAAMTVVVEAGRRSGALVTARVAAQLGRPVGAVPGRVTSSQAAGSNALLKGGAELIRDPQDVLDILFEAGSRTAPANDRPRLTPRCSAVLEAIGNGQDTAAALTRAGLLGKGGLAVLAELELAGYVQRQAGGRYAALP